MVNFGPLGFFMVALCNRADHYIFILFLLLSCCFSLPILNQLSQIGCLPYIWCGLSANLGCRSVMCCMRLDENTGHKKSLKICHLRTIAQICQAISSQLRCISTIGKNLLNSNISPTSSQYGELRPTSGWHQFWSLGHPSKFQWVSLLQRRHSSEANQTLHDVWPSPGLVHYMYIFGGSCPVTKFYQVQNSLCVQDLHSPILAALLHGTWAVGISETLLHWAEVATYIRQGGHHVGPTHSGLHMV